MKHIEIPNAIGEVRCITAIECRNPEGLLRPLPPGDYFITKETKIRVEILFPKTHLSKMVPTITLHKRYINKSQLNRVYSLNGSNCYRLKNHVLREVVNY